MDNFISIQVKDLIVVIVVFIICLSIPMGWAGKVLLKIMNLIKRIIK